MILQEGTILLDRYAIQRIFEEAGPIDITYQARDQTEEKDVVIREYFPVAAARRKGKEGSIEVIKDDLYAYGLAEYELEGNALTRLSHTHTVECTDHFKENGTVYRVSERRLGISLRAYLRQLGGALPEGDAIALLAPIIHGLEAGHEHGLIHGALSPTSVFMDQGRTPMLLNFQGARLFMAQLTGQVKEVRMRGCSPPEIRMDREAIGPWTDLFGVASLLYYIVQGRTLPTVVYPSHHERLRNAIDKAEGLSAPIKEVLHMALAMDYRERPQSARAMLELLSGAVPVQQAFVKVERNRVVLDTGAEESLSDWNEEEDPNEYVIHDEKLLHKEALNGMPEDIEDYSGEFQQPPSSMPAHRSKQLPSLKERQDQDLQSRLEMLENRQKGSNRLIGILISIIIISGVLFYFGPEILNRLDVSSPGSASAAPSLAESASANTDTATPAEELQQETPVTERTTEGPPTGSSREQEPALAAIELPPAQQTATAQPAQPEGENAVVSADPIELVNTQAELAAARAEQEAELLRIERQYQYFRDQGDVFLGEKRWEDAMNAYTTGLEYRPGDAYLRGRIAAAMDSIQNVAARAERAIEIERQYQYIRGQGDVLFQQKRWEEALNIYASALEIRPNDAYLTQTMAQARDSLETITRATEDAVRIENRIKRSTDENGIFIVPDTQPNLLDETTLRTQVKYPSRARRAGIEGRVIIRLVVDEQGRMQDPTVLEGIGFGCDEEVIRVLGEAQFEPATFNGEPVKAWYMFSLVFRLDEE